VKKENKTAPVYIERDGDIATVTLNAPEKLNALRRDSWLLLRDGIKALSAIDTVRCVVIRGAGEEAFAAGADISEFETVRANSKNAREYGELVAETVTLLAACRHPTLALIKGVCVGGGMEIAAACDMRIASENSRFGIPIKRLGLVAGYEEIRILLELVGPATVFEILYEGRILNASEALEKGFLNRVVADSEVETEAYETAKRIAEGAPLVARWHKRFIRRLADPTPLSQAELDEAYDCYDTEDYRIGRKAFLDKKKPEFKGS
jgi:enoyl-CoA hydratase/carnithine racemase